MNRIVLATLLVISTGGVAPSADQRQEALPNDGAWAKYGFIFTEESRTHSGTLEFRMVGTVTTAGGECRWLEIEFIDEKDERKSVVMKLRVQEMSLDDHSSIKVMAAWKKKDGDTINELTEDETRYIEQNVLRMFWASVENEKPLERNRIIKSQGRQIEITTAKKGTVNLPGGFAATKTIWPHMEVPFGFAAIDLSVKSGDVLIVKMQMSLKDFGTGAKSALPDAH